MSFFKKALASVGIGSAKVDTHVFNPNVRAGEEVKGEIEIVGGNVEQKIGNIYLEVMTEYTVEREDSKYNTTYCISKYDVGSSFTLSPGERKSLPFSFIIPHITPVSLKRKQVWIRTGLDIENAIDPSDKDYLNVQPTVGTQIILEALEGCMGMRIREIELEASRLLGHGIPFVQEFEFVPTGSLRGYLEELEIVFAPYPGGVDLFMEIDKRARGVRGFIDEMTGMDERRIRLSFTDAQLSSGPDYVAQELSAAIQSLLINFLW